MPEPPPRPARPSFADQMRRPAPPVERSSDRGDRGDPLAGFAPEPMGGRPEPRLEPRPDQIPPRLPRTEPMMPRPQRAAEPPKAPAPIRAPERAAAPPPPPPPPAPPEQSSADQNLAEMAQRLEAALRLPSSDVAPPVAPESPRAPRTDAPAPAPQKSGFENLEDEMASLLGRPKNSS